MMDLDVEFHGRAVYDITRIRSDFLPDDLKCSSCHKEIFGKSIVWVPYPPLQSGEATFTPLCVICGELIDWIPLHSKEVCEI